MSQTVAELQKLLETITPGYWVPDHETAFLASAPRLIRELLKELEETSEMRWKAEEFANALERERDKANEALQRIAGCEHENICGVCREALLAALRES